MGATFTLAVFTIEALIFHMYLPQCWKSISNIQKYMTLILTFDLLLKITNFIIGLNFRVT